MIRRLERVLFGTCAVLVGGSFLLASSMPAYAGHQGGGFREFRMQNSGLDRHVARRMFNADRQIDRAVGSVQRVPISADGAKVNRLSPNSHKMPVVKHQLRFDSIEGKRQSFQSTDNGTVVRLNSGIDLDLTSNSQNIIIGKNLFSDSVSSIEINVGGETKTLTAGSHVTAAEYVAAKQVLTGQTQSVLLDRSGVARGGSVDLGSLTQDNDVMRASNLVIANNVTTSGDFGRRSDFRLNGDLINYGTLNASSSDSNVRSGSVHADNITNHLGALINSSVDLTLDAAGSLNNDGTIVSAHGLTLAAGDSLNNTGSIRANENINIQSSKINNGGLIRSTAGDVNLNGNSTSSLVVNNLNGTIAALQGAINVRDTSYSGAAGSTVYGGDLLSRELNLNSGLGLVEVDVNQLTGTITETGSAAHVSASTDVLTIGNVCLAGDPTFYNQGDIQINGDLKVVQNLVIVAAGNITSDDNLTIQSGDAFNGHDITMIAGASFTAKAGKDTPVLPGPGGTAGGVILSGGASKTGGGIQLGSNVSVLAQSTDTIGPDSGGNIVLAAFGGKNDLAGKVLFATATLNTGGLPGGDNGNVTIIAGSKAGGTVVEMGVIDTTAGGDGSFNGRVSVTTSSPVSSVKNQPIEYDGTGDLISGALIASTKLNKGADIHVGNQSSGTELKASNDVTFAAGGNINIEGQVQTLLSNVTLQSGGTITGAAFSGVTAGSIDLEAGGDIGTDAVKFRVDTSTLTLNAASKGANAFIQTFGASPITTVKALTIKEQIVIDGSANRVDLFANSAKNVDVTAQKLSTSLQNPKGVDTLVLTSLDPTFDLNGSTLSGAKTVVLTSARDVGAIGIEDTFGKVKNLTVNAARNTALVINDSKTAAAVTAGNDITIKSNGMAIVSATATAGKVDLQSTGGTIAINGNVSAGTNVSIATDNAATSGKITFGANTQITGADVSISVGPTVGTPAPSPIANVAIKAIGGGTVSLTGSGVKAKAPTNSLFGIGSGHDVSINNGFKSGNITFGGGVGITAN